VYFSRLDEMRKADTEFTILRPEHDAEL
jgi:hypothetical protein